MSKTPRLRSMYKTKRKLHLTISSGKQFCTHFPHFPFFFFKEKNSKKGKKKRKYQSHLFFLQLVRLFDIKFLPMKLSLLISLATTLLASSSYSLTVKKNTATPAAVIHFPISKRNASPTETTSTLSHHRQRKRGVLTQSLINSV